MNVNDLIQKLGRNGHTISRDSDGKVMTWVDSNGSMPLIVDGKAMQQRKAERLLPWTERFPN